MRLSKKIRRRLGRRIRRGQIVRVKQQGGSEMNLKEIELKLALLSEPCPAITPELEEVAISCALGTTQYGSIKGAWWLTTTGYKNGDSAIWVPRRLNASYAFELLSELCEADIAGAFGLVGNCGWVSVNGRASRPVASLTEEIALAYIGMEGVFKQCC